MGSYLVNVHSDDMLMMYQYRGFLKDCPGGQLNKEGQYLGLMPRKHCFGSGMTRPDGGA